MIPVYALYCAELPEREKALRAHLQEREIPAKFWRGFHGNTWGLRTTKPYAPNEYISPGHVGLDLGFWSMLQFISMDSSNFPDEEDGYRDVFITFEDDVDLPEGFKFQVRDVLKELEIDFPEWDLVFLGMAECDVHVWHKVTKRLGRPNSRFCVLNEPFGTHAIMMRRRILPFLLDNLTVAERNLDQQLWSRVLNTGKVNWCAVLPIIAKQRTFDYTGKGKVEWQPSCIDPLHQEQQEPAFAAREQDLKRMAGALPPERPSSELISMSNLIIDPYPCIYRGEPLDGFGRDKKTGRSVPLVECAFLNKPCHSKKGLFSVQTENKKDVESCEKCKLRIQMPAERSRDRLNMPEGHFNPSFIKYQGRVIFASRDSWGHSKLGLWEAKNAKDDWTGEWSLIPIKSHASDHQEAPRLEDPRLFLDPQGALCCMLNLPDAYPPKKVQVGYVRFSEDLSKIEETVIFRSPANNLYEKNWSPFVYDGEIYWVYHTKPHHVVMGPSRDFTTPNNLPWTAGVIRGGAVPVLAKRGISDVFYHFFHGCLKRVQGSVYTIGCSVFDAKPPFRVLRQTSIPLVWPDLPAADEDVTKRYVIWPGGAIPHAGRWHIAVGVDDTFCRIISLPFEDVEKALNDVPETVKVTSIRDTPIAMGYKGEPTT